MSSISPYVGSMRISIKENLQFLGNWIDAVVTPILYLFLLYSIWSTLFPNDVGKLLPYFLIVAFVIEEARTRDLSIGYSNTILRGWDQSFTKPVSSEFFVILYSLGGITFYRIVPFIIGEVAVLLLFGPLAALIGVIAYLANIVLQFMLSYALTALTYWIHHIWGVGVVIGIAISLLGGFTIPLSYMSSDVVKFLDYTPFPYFFYYNAEAVITQDSAIILKLVTGSLAWSAIFLLVGSFLHAKGRKKFESFGG